MLIIALEIDNHMIFFPVTRDDAFDFRLFDRIIGYPVTFVVK